MPDVMIGNVFLFRWAAALLLAAGTAASALAEEAMPSKALMDDAMAALDRITGHKIADDDRAWLRKRWVENAERQPEVYADWLESIALAETLAGEGVDPLAVARMRAQIIDQLVCDAKQKTDPNTHRSVVIVAGPEVVLGEDCLTGAVVTRFDLKALAESNARVGDLVGSPVDVEAVEAELANILPDGLAELNPEGRQRLLWGEMRAVALEQYLAHADEASRKEFIAAARETFANNKDVASSALEMEKKALQQIDHVAAIARKDGFWFNPQEATTILSFLEHVTGASFSPGERLELVRMYAANFRKDPESITKFAANLRYWLDKGRYFGKDESGEIRSWTAEEQASTRQREAAIQYCAALSTGTAKDKRFIEILFGHDPVTDADCEAKTLTRESDRVVAEDGDYQFTRGALDAHRQAFELVFAFRFTDAERVWFDKAATEDVEAGRVGLSQAIEGFQRIAAEIRKDEALGPHLNERTREGYSVGVTCANRGDDTPNVARLFAIIDAHDPVVHEDCDRESVIRQSDVEGRIAALNFIAAIGGRAPLNEAERENLLGGIESFFNSDRSGPLHYRSEWAKFTHWWSRMPFKVRRRNAEEIRQEVGSLQGLYDMRAKLSSKASLNLGLMGLCDLNVEKLKHETQMAQIRTRSIFVQDQWGGWTWANPGDVFYAGIDTFNVLAPLVQQQCERAWE